MHPLIVLLIIIGVILAIRWYNSQAEKGKAPDQFKLALYIGGGILLLGLVTGRLNPLIAMVAAAIPALQRISAAKSLFEQVKSSIDPKHEQRSRIRTAMLEILFNHSGTQDTGTVLAGRFAGSTLGQLDQQQLMELMVECRSSDQQSTAALIAYLDRRFGPQWRQGNDSARPINPNSGSMNEAQARDILGVTTQANRDDIISAHKKLIQKLHPDRGGSNYLATQVNQARDYLLNLL